MVKTISKSGRRKRPIQQRSRKTVGYILRAATQVFGEFGYDGTTTNHIAERAGVSIGTLYQYFPNKQALLLSLAESHLDEARRGAEVALRKLRDAGSTPEEYFRGFIGFIVDFHQGEDVLHDLFFVEAPQGEHLRELVAGIGVTCAKEIESYMRDLGYDEDCLALKSRVLAEICGSVAHDLVLSPPPGSSPESCTDEIVAACLGYLARTERVSKREAS